MAVAKKIRETIDYHFKNGDIEKAKKAIMELLKSKRPTAKLHAAKLIIEHERDLNKHENPKPQHHVHEFPQNITVEIVDPKK